MLAELLAKKERQRHTYPQSFSQQRIWFLEQLQPGTALFNVPAAVRLCGRRWQIPEAERAINEVIRRHLILRTTFDQQDGQPVQIVSPPKPVSVTAVDLSQRPPAERETEVQRIIGDDARRPFDLVAGPLLRFQLLITGRDEQVIYFNMHHLISDGPSVVVMMRELAILYMAYCAKLPTPLPKLPAQFTDFVRWQRDAAEGELFSKQLSYWRDLLRDVPPTLHLPTDRPRPPVARFHGNRESFAIPRELTHALRKLGQRESVTQFMIVLSAFQALLFRYSGQERLCVGSPVTGRNRADFEPLIGCFANVLAFPADFTGDPTFRELLARTRRVTLGAFDNQDLPFERVVDAIHDRRDLSRAPLFQVMFSFSSMVGKQQEGFARVVPGLEIGGMEWEKVEVGTGTSMFDLTFWVDELPDGLHGMMEYNTDLFDADTIRQLLTHYERLLEQVAAAPNKKVSQILLLDDAERNQLLIEWNETDADLPDVQAAHQLFEQRAHENPDHVAVVFEREQRTYAELDREANQLAHHLQQFEVGPDELVAICLPRSPDLVVAMLAVLKAGGAFLPIDPTYPAERIEFMLRDSAAKVLIGSSGPERSPQWSGIEVLDLSELRGACSSLPVIAPTCEARPNCLAYAIYTSGSTGQPKAVAVEHTGLVNLIESQRQAFHVGATSRVLQFASASFDASVSEIFVTLSAGATLVLAPQEKLLDPDELLKILRSERITTVTLPPSLLGLLPATDLPSLETVVSAGERCSTRIVNRWAPGRRFINAYGPTETTVCATLTECLPGDATPSIGRPIANTQIYVLDRHRQPLPVGVPGELYVGGRGVARGYLKQPELTRERFVEWSPQSSSRSRTHTHDEDSGERTCRLYRTGDLVRWRRDGQIEFFGRVDEQVKIRGMRVELGEVESALQAHSEIREAAVVADDRAGGIAELVAFCVFREGSSLSADTIRDFLAEKLPAYMVPTRCEFLESLSRLPNGKVDRRALLAQERSRPQQTADYVAPSDELETALVEIWQDVLAVERVGVRDNFFSLGGHSLSAVVLKFRLQEELDKNIPLASLFRAPTIEQLAAELQRSTESLPSSPWVPLRSDGTKPPLVLVHPTAGNAFCYLELPQHIDDDRPLFAIQSLGLDGTHPPQTSIADMAASYVAALGEQLPDGPFVLGGWSMGGVVALEMAQQLEAASRVVPLLVVLDAPLLDTTDASQPLEESALHAFLLAELNNQLGHEIDVAQLLEQLGAEETPTIDELMQSPQQLEELLQQSSIADILPSGTGWDEIQHHLAVVQANLVAHQGYRAKPYGGDVVLFCADESLSDALFDAAAQWQALVTGQLTIRRVPGNHYTMLQSPHVETLSRLLSDAIAVIS